MPESAAAAGIDSCNRWSKRVCAERSPYSSRSSKAGVGARVSLHAIASVMIDRVGGASISRLNEMCGTPGLIESGPVSIVRDLVSIGIADRAVRSSND
jgi:hypothetical protein